MAVTVLGLTGFNALAQSSWPDRFTYAPNSAVFGPREFSVDILGGYATRDKSGADDDAFGIGVGVNYFIFDNIGVGIDTYADAFTTPYLLNFSGIYRYPIKDFGLAPYGFGGFGRQWEHDPRWTGHLGLGLEYRFNMKTGLFMDGRGVFGGDDYALWRLGFRFGF
jgi:hypothetical protein